MANTKFTDEFWGMAQDTMDLPQKEAAAIMGIHWRQVSYMRTCIRRGKTATWARLWREEEDEIILSMRHASTDQIAEVLTTRTRSAIASRRIQIDPDPSRNNNTFNPFVVGSRPLVAKSCVSCGLVLAGSKFGWLSGQKAWASSCKSCLAAKQREYAKRTGQDTGPASRARQAISLPHATRHGQVWTDKDMAILADPNLTILEKALLVNRTYYATTTAVARYGFASAPPEIGDPERDVWIIDNPNEALMESSSVA